MFQYLFIFGSRFLTLFKYFLNLNLSHSVAIIYSIFWMVVNSRLSRHGMDSRLRSTMEFAYFWNGIFSGYNQYITNQFDFVLTWYFSQYGKPHKRVIRVKIIAPLFDDPEPDEPPGICPGVNFLIYSGFTLFSENGFKTQNIQNLIILN